MPRLGHLGVHPMSAPGLTPAVIAGVLALLGLALLARSLRERAALSRAEAQSEPSGGDGQRAVWGRALLALVLCLLYAPGLLGRLPFMWATGLFVFAFVAAFSFERARPIRSLMGAAAMALGVAVGVDLLFEQVFLVRLP
jgi:putative tricarboxylic transport membrane protein